MLAEKETLLYSLKLKTAIRGLFMVSRSWFGGEKPTPTKSTSSDNIPIPDALQQISTKIANELVSIIRTEMDIWWFVVHQFDRLKSSGESIQNLLNLFPIQLHEIEYKWGKIEPFIAEIKNPGIDYLDQVKSTLSDKFGDDLANLTIAYAFTQYCTAYQIFIHGVRLKFATHFRDGLKSSEHASIANRWDKVVRSLA